MKNAAPNDQQLDSSQKSLIGELGESFSENADKVALTWKHRQTTYRELYRASDRIKNALIERGCRRGSRVALLVEHTPALVAAILGVLRAGAAYVPLDRRSPEARTKFMIDDSGADLCITDQKNRLLADSLNVDSICIDGMTSPQNRYSDQRLQASDLAYVLYTSGSTGRPKGVGITHSNLLVYSNWAARAYFSRANDCIALYSTLTFDFTATSIFPPLLAGASISVFDGITDPFVIREIAANTSINVLKITPAYLRLLLELSVDISHLTRVIVGGEDLSVHLAANVQLRLNEGAEIINEYGPTETTVGCVVHTYNPRLDQQGSVPIGHPIPGVEALVINDLGEALSGACKGELIIAGANVAPGYINLPQKTSETFAEGGTLTEARSYRTGDLVRRGDDGSLVFIGRRDDQVKIRGNRVELGEVTAALLEIAAVRSAFILAIPEHNTHVLAAAVVIDDQSFGVKDLQTTLAAKLPDYMVPSAIRIVAEIPLSQNQKIDRDKVLTLFGKKGERDVSATHA